MGKPLVDDPQKIRLAMLGMVDGNGHPYSWSAIINGRYEGVLALLEGKRSVLEAVARRLLEVETLTGDEFRAIASAA